MCPHRKLEADEAPPDQEPLLPRQLPPEVQQQRMDAYLALAEPRQHGDHDGQGQEPQEPPEGAPDAHAAENSWGGSLDGQSKRERLQQDSLEPNGVDAPASKLQRTS